METKVESLQESLKEPNGNEIFKQFGEKINCLTLEFAKNNLANDKLEKHLFNELEDEFLQSLKVLLGGKK